MAIYHLSMGHVSRSTGRSSVQAIAYITRSCLLEERRGLIADYRNSTEEVFWETLAPEGSGIRSKDLSIWNKLEAFEDDYAHKRYKSLDTQEKYKNSAQVAHTYVFALPKELSQTHSIDLIREIVAERFVDRGMVATYSIHWEEGNPHAHIIVSHRAVEGNIFEGGTFSWLKVARELCTRTALRETRKLFADKTNALFESLGMEERIDHRSFAERGIELIPTQHKGWMAHQLERDGLQSRIVTENESVSQENKERVAEYPGIILKELTSIQATFSERDVVRLTQRRMKDDPSYLTQYVIESVLREAVAVGTGIDHTKRYTSQDYFDKETKVLESFESYQNNKAKIKIDPTKVEEWLHKLDQQGQKAGYKPTEGQVLGIKTLCGDNQLSLMIGRAGTGKTTTLKSVVQLHQEAGYQVWGMAPSATAASQLEADTGCKSDTIAHYAYYWKKYDEALDLLHRATTDKEMKAAQEAIDQYKVHLPTSDTLLIVDEAGMVGVGDGKDSIPGGWDAITNIIDRTGAKLILVGDDHQFKPIEAGDVFRRLVHQLKGTDHLCELTEIKRQNVPWMREASTQLAELNISTALGMYENQGHIQEHTSKTDVYEAIAQQYLRNLVRAPDSRGLAITATNEERQALNREIRFLLKENGHLPKEDVLYRGEDGYTVGDKIIFTKNDRGYKTAFEAKDKNFFVRNSMHAVITSINPCLVTDRDTGEIMKTHEIVAHVADQKATIRFTLNNFKDFAHGYAVTGWKSQSDTLDWTLAKLSKYMDAYGLYVILTRHREDVSLYYSKQEFADFKALTNTFSRTSVKDLVVDYSVSDENKEYWQNAQDYKETGRELTAISALARSMGKSSGGNKENKAELKDIWENYRHVEADRKSWAKCILTDWEEHKDFVRQAGLTKESLEIAAGLRKRSLSRLEAQAQVVVEQYTAAALEARELWRDIRQTRPGVRAKSHPEWQKFEEVRDQRGILANQIYQNPTLYRPFLRETAESLSQQYGRYSSKNSQNISYSLSTIQAQAEAHQSKMLQRELLKDDARHDQQEMLKVLITYTESRDMAGSIWHEVRPKLKQFEGTLLKEPLTKAIAEYTEVRIKRDAAALEIMAKPEAFTELAKKVGIKLDSDRLKDQATQATRDRLLDAYQNSSDSLTKLEAAHELCTMIKNEAELEKKPTLAFIYQQGLTPKDITKDALAYQRANGLDPSENATFSQSLQDKEDIAIKLPAPTDAQVLAYLQQEISTQKHSWLSEFHEQRLLKAANEDPMATLKRWQEISGDESFKPSSQADSLTLDQQEAREKIFTYLQEQAHSQKYPERDKRYWNNLFEMAEKDPLKGLQHWQYTMDDYSFNPFRELLNEREIRIQDYLQARLVEEGDMFTREKRTELACTVLHNPLEAYKKWNELTGDQSFDPTSGYSQKEQEAQTLMTQLKRDVSEEVYKGWHDNLTHNSEAIIKDCTNLLHIRQEEAKLDKAVKDFVSLSELYEKTHWKEFEKKHEMNGKLSTITETYWKDKQFLQKLETTKSQAAIERMQDEIRMQQRDLSRGMDMGL